MLRHITRAVLVILFVLLVRMVLYMQTDRSLDNVLAPVLASAHWQSFHNMLVAPPPALPPVIPQWVLTEGCYENQYLLDSQQLAEFIGVGTGIMVWVFVASFLYLGISKGGEGVTRCRRCRGILKNLTKPACDHCGEAI